MAFFIGLLILTGALIFQSAILSQIQLLSGTLDLVFLCYISWVMRHRTPGAWQWAILAGALVGYVSALPFWAPILAYLMVTAWGLFLRSRVWQVPILAVLTASLTGTLIYHGIALLALLITGSTIKVGEAISLIILPSTLLNVIGTIPINGIVGEIANWVFPLEVDET